VPCALQLSPGVQRIRVEGDGKVTEKIVVPSNGGNFGLRYVTPSQTYWGVGLGVVGAGVLIGGLVDAAENHWKRGFGQSSPWAVLQIAGVATMVTGGILILTGGIRRLEIAPTSPPAAATGQSHVPQFGVAPTRDGAAMGMSMQF
jgi:hypothetical protein